MIRNLAIMIAALAIAVAATELFLGGISKNTVSQEEFDQQNCENGWILLMQTEQMDHRDLLSAVMPSSELYASIVDSLSQEEKDALPAEEGKRYPLISHMQRGEDYDDDTVNIVVLGDSFTWGQSVTNRNEVYWRLLETSLRSQGYNVRVYGVGMLAANSFDELHWLRDTTLTEDLQPDLIVIGYLYNDPDDSKTEADVLRKSIYVQPNEKLRPALSVMERFLPNIARRLKIYLVAKTMYTAPGLCVGNEGGSSIVYAPILKDRCYHKFKREFIEPLDAFAGECGVPVVLMPLAVDSGETMLTQLYQPLHELCGNTKNIKLFDSTHDFFHGFASSKHAANYRINIADLHPGSAMNRFYAQYMEKFLKKDFADLLGAPAGRDLNADRLTVNEALPWRTIVERVREDADEAVYTVRYPSLYETHPIWTFDLPYYLTLPIEKDYISFSLSRPTDLADVEVTGKDAEDVEILYQCVNEKLGYDDHTVRPFGTKDGGVWTDEAPDRVTRLLIHAKCKNDAGADLTLRIRAADRRK